MPTSEHKKKFFEAKGFLDRFHKILIASHEYTDGDDLGAALALSRVLAIRGRECLVAARGGVPDNLLFLPGQSETVPELPPDFADYEVLVTIGCGNLARTGFAELQTWLKPILNIDHHHDSQSFGTVNVLKESAAANCELLYEMFSAWGEEIDKFTALCLLTGIFTDTGGFRHANVTARTLEIAAELLRRGGKLDLVSRFTASQKELPKLRAWALALERAEFDENQKMIYTVITREDLEKVEAKEGDLEGVAELLNTIPEAKFSMLLRERGEEIKGSLRSETHKGVDVSQIARVFGGGGHKLAAGFKFKGKIEKTSKGWRIT